MNVIKWFIENTNVRIGPHVASRLLYPLHPMRFLIGFGGGRRTKNKIKNKKNKPKQNKKEEEDFKF